MKTAKPKLPKNAPTTVFTILIDSREPEFQRYDFKAFGGPLTRVEKLEEGDYSAEGLKGVVAIERKTLDDLAKSIIQDRFWAELDRAREQKYTRFVIVVEGTMADAEAGLYGSSVKPAAVLSACLAITSKYGFPVIWAGSRQAAARWVASFLLRCHDNRDQILQEKTIPEHPHIIPGCFYCDKENPTEE